MWPRRRGSRVRSRNRYLESFLIIAAIFGAWFYLGRPGSSPPVLGNATIRDADTLTIAGETFRLLRVDALEYHQSCIRTGETTPWPCGRDAARALAGRISGQTLACSGEGRDRYGRTLATCRIGDADIAEWLVENGFAFDTGSMGFGRYAALEREASKAKRGAWSGSFEKPWQWRAEHPQPER